MAKFIIYTYQFSPLVSDLQSSDLLFDDLNIPDKDEVMKKKQDIFAGFFKTDDGICFHSGDEVFKHKLLLNFNGIIAFRIANNKILRHEEDFRVSNLVDQPSCLVVIDNRRDCQNIAIQSLSRSFASTDKVANILKLSFNECLKKHFLRMEVLRRYEERTFWNLVDRHPEGIKGLRFSFSYPNLPRVSDNAGELFVELGKQFNANSKYELSAIEGQTLNINRNDEKLGSLVKASSSSGHDIGVLPARKGASWISTGNTSFISTEISESNFVYEEGAIFDDRYEAIAEAMNEFKK